MKDVPKNMRRSGMLFFMNGFVEALHGITPICVAHVAHAAEILLKARIAQEHPLLIFSKLPKSSNSQLLAFTDLLENGRTFSYEELPDRLWATTGIKIDNIDAYRKFGRLRNQVIHFSLTNKTDLDILTLEYSLKILDPLVISFWHKSVIEFLRHSPSYYDEFDTGHIEMKMKDKGIIINQELRKLLGEESKKSLKKMEEKFENHSFSTVEELELEFNRDIDPVYNNWQKFLDSF